MLTDVEVDVEAEAKAKAESEAEAHSMLHAESEGGIRSGNMKIVSEESSLPGMI